MEKRKLGMSALLLMSVIIAGAGLLLLCIGLLVGLKTAIPVLPIVLEIIGGFLLFMGIVLFSTEVKNRKRIADAMNKGKPIVATVTKTEENVGLTVKGEHPVHLLCEYRDPELGESHVYRSMDMRTVPKNAVGKKVTVYVNTEDDSYFVDLSSIEETH